jgi:hypothetical protein
VSKSGEKAFYKKWWFWVIVILILGIAIAIGSQRNKDKSSDSNTNTDTTVNETEPETKDEDTKINYTNFLSVQMGQKYEEVVNLLGQGTEKTSSEVSGVKTTLYSWEAKGENNLNVTIQNGVVIGKAQFGLKSMDAGITLEKYNGINNGMTYEQVKEILGEGQIVSQDKSKNSEITMYEYANKDGSNADITISGDSVKLKSQSGLK